ncbi:hypothetical protein [Clavibacter tessellarius]|uniref:hypothetical protein n=1 Tax=Clavibacter tessellarius TaxID=31965 RepID=UPI003253D54D
MTALPSDVDAWALTAAITPRTTVRVAAVDASGAAVNLYPHHRRTAGPVPAAPWAMYLAGTDHLFRILGFDLDAKTVDGAAAAARDADTLAALLEDAGLQPLVCASGPTGGRHVWVGLAEGIDAALVATLARLVRHVCPTLDLSPLSNPATGCLRPPGAPHRAGGRSTVLRGDTSTLTAPTGTAAQVRGLTERVAQLVDVDDLTPSVDPHRPVPVDDHSRLYLPGPRRELPASAEAALQEDAAAGDASAVLRRILVGAAAARWRHADVAERVETAPGLEHVRTAVVRGQRVRRRPVEAAAVLRRQWDRAVQFVAATPRQIGADPTFDARAATIAADVDALQQRADTSAGRWAHGGGPADRRVLDALCVLALQAVRASVEADTRRLALLAGIGRETARTALHRLAADGWIRRERGADGPHGAHWTITPAPALHKEMTTGRSQADPRPAGAGAALRSLLLDTLTHRISAAAHDLFTPGGSRPRPPRREHLRPHHRGSPNRRRASPAPSAPPSPAPDTSSSGSLPSASSSTPAPDGGEPPPTAALSRPSAHASTAASLSAPPATRSSGRHGPGGARRTHGCAPRAARARTAGRPAANSPSSPTTAPTPTARTRVDPTADLTGAPPDASSSSSAEAPPTAPSRSGRPPRRRRGSRRRRRGRTPPHRPARRRPHCLGPLAGRCLPAPDMRKGRHALVARAGPSGEVDCYRRAAAALRSVCRV